MAETPGPTGRRVVSVLFSDIIGSTGLGEQLDPELYRQVLTRYFDAMKRVVDRHGGRTEKFIGDAIVAVFGVPNAHEDDALRAVKTATDMADAITILNGELERTWGIKLRMRTGITTGEVMAGAVHGDDAYVAGGIVNLAARLQQGAQPGEILIGEATYQLVRHAATTESVDPLTIKGRTEALPAWRLLGVSQEAPIRVRRMDAPVIGRDLELARIQDLFQQTTSRAACHLLTLVGTAGIGKSRLTTEFLSRIDDSTTVVRGRCLPYGEGITFWPLTEVIRGIAGINELEAAEDARIKISGLLTPGPEAVLVSERLAALLGLSPTMPAIQETFWAVRKLLEEAARRSPLVVVLDDIHWGEPTFLDLLEYLVDWIEAAPVLLLCQARPDLLETRDWMRGKNNASIIQLAPLGDSDTSELIQNLLHGSRLSSEAQARISAVAEGNPLFIEEILRMLVDDGLLRFVDGRWTVTGDLSKRNIPPTIQALLAARLDRLDTEERHVIERAAVVGRQFWWGAVWELSDEDKRSQVGGRLQSLVRKELVARDHSELRGEDAFRFTHILIRDAAYAGIPKLARAQLHEQFAAWIERKTRDSAGEFEEIVAYHLEQAYVIGREVGPKNGSAQKLAARAATLLASAGRRAFARGDMPAAINLLTRAEQLFPREESARLQCLPDLAFALAESGDFNRMREVVDETVALADAQGDESLRAEATILGLWVRLYTDPEGWADEAFRQANEALSTFQRLGNERGLARGWSLLAIVQLLTCQFARSEAAWEEAAAHAREAGDERLALDYLSYVPLVVWGGPTHSEEGIARCRQILERAAGDRKAMSAALFTMGKFEAMRGRFNEARGLIEQSRSMLHEVKLPMWDAGPLAQMSGWVDILAGDLSKAERDLRAGVHTLQEIGEMSWLSTVAAILAEAVYLQGRDSEAEEFAALAEQAGGSEDAYTQVLLRSVRSRILSRQGQSAEAERLARDAVAIAQRTDFLFVQAIALLTLGEVLERSERASEAAAVLEAATQVCSRKGFVVGLKWAEQLSTAAASSAK